MLKRLGYIDILKGVGIIFVVTGHLYLNPFVDEYIYSFHLPLFFFVSGLLLNVEKYSNFKDFFVSRIKSLYVPFFFFYLLIWFYWYFIERHLRSIDVSPFETAFGIIWGSDSQRWIYPAGVLWFVMALLSLEIILYSIVKQNWNHLFKVIFLAILFFVGLVLAYYNLFLLPWGINNALICIPFISVGYACRKQILFDNIITDKKKLLLFYASILLFINLLCVYFFEINIDLSRLIICNLLLYLTVPFIGTASWFLFCKAICKNTLLQWFGRNSLAILAFHPPISRAVTYLLGILFDQDREGIRENLLYALLLIVLTLIICWPFCIVWNRFYGWLKTKW